MIWLVFTFGGLLGEGEGEKGEEKRRKEEEEGRGHGGMMDVKEWDFSKEESSGVVFLRFELRVVEWVYGESCKKGIGESGVKGGVGVGVEEEERKEFLFNAGKLRGQVRDCLIGWLVFSGYLMVKI